MAHISGDDRSQLLLLPDAVDDYVGPDNPVRFIDAFVDNLDLAAAGFERVEPKDTGRPGYDPADLLKLYIYGYLNRVRSSRRLEAETHRNLEVIWLLRRLKPDFKTIADFRRDNHKAFRAVYRDFVRLRRGLDLHGRELIAVDGTGIKAVNSAGRNFTKPALRKDLELIDQGLERYLQQLAEKTLEERGEAQLSLTDPDARALAPSKRVGVGLVGIERPVDQERRALDATNLAQRRGEIVATRKCRQIGAGSGSARRCPPPWWHPAPATGTTAPVSLGRSHGRTALAY